MKWLRRNTKYQAQKKAKIKQRLAKEERNKRTKRLIEIGATIEAALECEIPADKLPALSAIIKQDQHKYDILNALNTQKKPLKHFEHSCEVCVYRIRFLLFVPQIIQKTEDNR